MARPVRYPSLRREDAEEETTSAGVGAHVCGARGLLAISPATVANVAALVGSEVRAQRYLAGLKRVGGGASSPPNLITDLP